MLEQPGGVGACSGDSVGALRDLAVQQRPGGRLRAWALGTDGVVAALDEAPVSRGVRGACAQLLGDADRGLAAASDAELQLQVLAGAAGSELGCITASSVVCHCSVGTRCGIWRRMPRFSPCAQDTLATSRPLLVVWMFLCC